MDKVPDFRDEASELYEKHKERIQLLSEIWNERIKEMMDDMRNLVDVYDEMVELHEKMQVLVEKWLGEDESCT